MAPITEKDVGRFQVSNMHMLRGSEFECFQNHLCDLSYISFTQLIVMKKELEKISASKVVSDDIHERRIFIDIIKSWHHLVTRINVRLHDAFKSSY